MTDTQFYKVLVAGKSAHGGSLEWSLPTNDEPGEWQEVTGSPVLCEQGLHLTTDLKEWWKPGAEAYLVEVAEDAKRTEFDSSASKIAVSKCRLVRKLTPGELADLGIIVAGATREIRSGTVIVDGGTVRACGSSTVKAWGSSTVEAYDSSTVEAYGSSTVKAYDSSTVRAYDSSTVKAWGSSTVKAYDSSTVKACGSSTVKAWGSSTVEAYDSSTVEACGSSTVEACDSSTVEACAGRSVVVLLRGSVLPEIKEFAIVIDRRTAGTVGVFGASGKYGDPL
jgi:hypothetical protein